ncbi:abc-type oligopeptide transport system, periplasmic component [Lapidilactobacillus dextrinicus DSM 20335]|uniref:Abc-type oligopeptide transport system, periplasmic component n=1 Tax=Lapidilactobacillus dextrinicus DSM 20335 TaxID=1423738 RepID=A0A0R2BI75_9LACO|nr:peptide ABC transporter substrate-binding protein [Lapidilactobacillus dextrinicus]KRM78999.1 abc-type oligopeptide transport system, periplasmic component [Lapidilactobacillus dextrinicus DSM 20335]QFG46028.1 peptide ABC transporter substrate-binding protein [Lapidilactobacillus dextrinicus]
MKWKKKGLLTVALVSVALLATACGNDNKASSKTGSANSQYSYVYSTDPDNFDYTVTSRATNSGHLVNFVNGLLENDKYGRLTGAMAKSWDVSDDGKTYTYHLRKGINWVDSQGNVYDKVTAQDFVTGLKHAVAAKSETLYVVQDSITGLSDYVAGKTSDFSKVGVKALDDNTVQYTLNQPESYWNSKLTYGVMFPVNAKFLKSQGKDFGKASADSILYNGPYILANFTSKSVIEYKENPNYWDKKDVHIKDVKLTYDDGSNPDGLYKSYIKGDYSQARVYPTSADYKNVLKQSKNDIVWSDPDATTYNFTFNLNRQSYNDTSKKTTKAKEDTKKAILNRNFRLAVQFAFDKKSYNAQATGSDAAEKSLRNTMTPPNFVQINGQPYGDAVKTDLTKLDSTAFGDIDLSDAQDGTYNPTKAKEYFAKAKKELEAEGVSFPIHLDLPAEQKAALNLNKVKSFKSTVEKNLGTDNLVIDIQLLSEDKYLAATYQAATAAASDFDISNASGWSPDYDDPSSYLDIYNPDTGAQLTTIGLNLGKGNSSDTAAKEALGMDEYVKLLDKASAITTDTNARYQAYAEAEAWLLNSGIQIPVNSLGGTPSVTRVVPYTVAYAQSGLYSGSSTSMVFKGVKLQTKPVTTAQSNKARKAWEAKRAEIAKETADK